MRAATVLLTLSAIAAQTLQFEVASIKPSPPPDGRGYSVYARGGPGSDDPSIFICKNFSIAGLIWRAYDVEDYQIAAPEWAGSTRFDISARVPLGATKEQFRVMLQNLLAERFQMTFHRAKKEMTTFNLVVAKNGPKFKDYTEPSAGEPPHNGPPQKDAEGFPILPPGKGFSIAIMNNRAAMRGGGTLEDFALIVSKQLRQPVVNATGLKGKYDIALTWIPGDPKADDPGPSIFQALQDQLGLKLESRKGMIDMLVIDHIEKTPTEN